MIIISQPAQDDLNDIWWNIAQDSPVAANNVINIITDTFLSLSQTPSIGRIRPEICSDLTCFTAFQSGWRSRFLIFYRVTKKGLEIARVLESHQDISPDFFQ